MPLTFTPNGHNKFSQVCEAIADLANNGGGGASALTSVNASFTALAKAPGRATTLLPYPFLYPSYPTFTLADRAMGRNSDKFMRYTIPLILLIDPSNNDPGALMDEAQEYILPIYTLFLANRSLEGCVQNIIFNGVDPLTGGELQSEGIVGDLTLNNNRAFGLEIPMHIFQRQPIASQL
jgi:hypothetical protein